MTIWQRMRDVLFGLFMVASAIFLIVYDDKELGSLIVALVISFMFILRGARILIFYFMSARHMVSGLSLLYIGLIAFDMGLFAFTIVDDPNIFIMIYLVGCHAFSGVIGVLHSLESKHDSLPWFGTLAHGVIDILLSVLCIAFLRNPNALILIYAIGLIHSAIIHVINAFRSQDIVYIP